MTYSILLTIHIIAGTAAVMGGVAAIFTKMIDASHRWHVYGGRVFYYGMVLVFLTTVPMAIIKPNLFLLLIGIFSFYLAFTGWRMAVNRTGFARPVDFAAILVMGITAMGMAGWGIYLFLSGEGTGITLAVFGAIGGALAFSNIKKYTHGPVKGKDRIASHIGNMMGAFIAAFTAVLVVNIQTDPVWIAWLAPTVIITPLIFWMIQRVYARK